MNRNYTTEPLPREAAAASASPAPELSHRRKWAYVLALAALAALPYLSTLRNDFVYDDLEQVLANPYIRNFHHLREIFTSSVWSFMGDFRGSTNFYRPMMSLGYLFCYRLFGPSALGFHLANVLMNVGVVILVFLLTRRLFRSSAVAFLAASIFALHPIHSEAVNWIAAVTELELAFFYLLTFWLFLASARPGGKCSVPLQAAMVGSFALTLLSKEQALTLPLLAVLYEHFFRDDRAETTFLQKFRRYVPLWLLMPAYLLLRARYLGGFAPKVPRLVLGTKDVVISAFAMLGWHCWKLIWPAKLCAYYLFPYKAVVLDLWALGGVLALALWAGAFVILRRFNRQAAFGVLWLLVTLAPVLNVRWLTSNPFAERYLYLASVGFCWIAGWCGVRVWNLLPPGARPARAALAVVAGVVAVLCLVRIVIRNRDWHDNITFYTATLAVSPRAYYIHNNLGTVYWAQGNVAAADKEWRIALRLTPTNEYVLHNLGLVALTEKQYPQAEALFLRALAIRPDYSDAHLDLGRTYQAAGRTQDAEKQITAAVVISPLNVRAHYTLSEFYFDLRRLPQAEAEARRSVDIEPTVQGYWDLGLAEWVQGNRPGAERAFLGAEALDPSSSKAHFMLGLFYMDCNRNGDALREYREGLRYDPGNSEALTNVQKLEFLGAR